MSTGPVVAAPDSAAKEAVLIVQMNRLIAAAFSRFWIGHKHCEDRVRKEADL